GAFVQVFPAFAESLFIALLTVGVLLVGEIAPKTIGVAHASAMAVPVAHAIHGMVVGLRPVLVVTRQFSRLVGAGQQSAAASRGDIGPLATAGQAPGAFGARTAALIANATRLRDTRVREVMVARNRVAYLSGSRSVRENLELVQRTGHSRFPYT